MDLRCDSVQLNIQDELPKFQQPKELQTDYDPIGQTLKFGDFENNSLLPMNDDLIRFFELNMAGKTQEEQKINEIKNRHKRN